MAHRGEAEVILAAWREIERELEAAEPGSPEFEKLASGAAMMRDEYQRIVAEARGTDGLPSEVQPAN